MTSLIDYHFIVPSPELTDETVSVKPEEPIQGNPLQVQVNQEPAEDILFTWTAPEYSPAATYAVTGDAKTNHYTASSELYGWTATQIRVIPATRSHRNKHVSTSLTNCVNQNVPSPQEHTTNDLWGWSALSYQPKTRLVERIEHCSTENPFAW